MQLCAAYCAECKSAPDLDRFVGFDNAPGHEPAGPSPSPSPSATAHATQGEQVVAVVVIVLLHLQQEARGEAEVHTCSCHTRLLRIVRNFRLQLA